MSPPYTRDVTLRNKFCHLRCAHLLLNNSASIGRYRIPFCRTVPYIGKIIPINDRTAIGNTGRDRYMQMEKCKKIGIFEASVDRSRSRITDLAFHRSMIFIMLLRVMDSYRG